MCLPQTGIVLHSSTCTHLSCLPHTHLKQNYVYRLVMLIHYKSKESPEIVLRLGARPLQIKLISCFHNYLPLPRMRNRRLKTSVYDCDFQLVVQKLRREFTHAQNFLFKIPAQVRACADSRRDFWTTNWYLLPLFLGQYTDIDSIVPGVDMKQIRILFCDQYNHCLACH